MEKKEKDMTLSLSREELALVKPGWYWYEDGSFSPVLQSEKKLKAVVVLIEYSTIYGDAFMEKTCHLNEAKTFLKECQEKLGEKVYLPTLREHIFIGECIDDINAALARVENVPLWEGTYMTGTDYACRQMWIKTYPRGSYCASHKGGSYKVRPLIYRSIN